MIKKFVTQLTRYKSMLPDDRHLAKCNSFVFLDLETTGLIGKEADGGRTKITELCLVAVSRETFTKIRTDLPRVLHKISIPVNPLKPIPDSTFKITGLNNELLSKENSFDDGKASLLKCFLAQLSQPLCLVAHNGYRFDFPLLKEALNFTSLKIIPEVTRCVDTIHTFRDLYFQPDIDEFLQFNPFTKEIDLELIKAADKCERGYAKSIGDVAMSKDDVELVRMLNETTPVSQKIIASQPNELNSKKRKLFADDENSDHDAPQTSTWSRPSLRGMPNFSLHNVHLNLFGCEPQSAHRAEDDVISLIKCCLRCGPRILQHFDRNSQLFSNVRRLYFE